MKLLFALVLTVSASSVSFAEPITVTNPDAIDVRINKGSMVESLIKSKTNVQIIVLNGTRARDVVVINACEGKSEIGLKSCAYDIESILKQAQADNKAISVDPANAKNPVSIQ